MNVVPMIKHTKAEEALLEAYDGFGGKSASSDEAIATLKSQGLPTRRVEAYHYTDLRSLVRSVPNLSTKLDDATAKSEAGTYQRLVEATRIPLFDGHAHLALGDKMESGVSVSVGQRSLKAADDAGNAIGLIGQAFGGDCVTLKISEGTEIKTPIGLAHVSTKAALAVSQHEVFVGKNASVTFIDRYVGGEETAYQNNAVTNLTIEDDATVNYLIVQQNGRDATHLGQINVTLGKNANFMMFVLNAGGKIVRHDLNINVMGEGADYQLRGVNLIGDDQHIDVTMNLLHGVANTTSEEILRNVVTGRGKGVFQGQIRVAQIAQKTDAKMACNTLLLSDEGDFSTKPELEIFADDVICGHGATFADIEPSYMFYLMSRGISEKEARALLIKGFVDEIVEDLKNEPLEEALISVIDSWLDANG